jgi:hypothetical protein
MMIEIRRADRTRDPRFLAFLFGSSHILASSVTLRPSHLRRGHNLDKEYVPIMFFIA